MNEPKLESLTLDEQGQLYASGLKQAEANFVNAKVNYLAASAALEAIRSARNAALSPPVVPVTPES